MSRVRVGRNLFLGLLGASLPLMAAAMGGGGGSMPSMDAPQYDPVAEYRNGVADLQAGKFSQAERDFDHVLDAAPDNADALFMLGMAKSGQGDLKGAAKAYQHALHSDPKQIPAARELAITDAKLGQPDKAQAQLAALKARDSACAGTCPEAADLKAAIAAVEAALSPSASAAPTSASLLLADAAGGDRSYVQAVRLINLHRYQDALVALRQAQAVFGPHPDILTYTGFVYRKLGQYDLAAFYYRQALSVAPNHLGATEYYGELMVERGDMAGARRMLGKLDSLCSFGCAEAEELRRWVDDPQSHRS